MSPHARRPWVVVGVVLNLLAGAARAADAADDAPNDIPIELSTVTVDSTRLDPVKLDIPRDEWDWRAGSIGEIEFLTSASPEETQRLLTRFYEFTQLLEWMVPQWQRPAGRPLRLVLCGARNSFDTLRPIAAENSLRDAVTAYLPDDYGAIIVADLEARELELLETHGLIREGGFTSLNGETTDDSDSIGPPELAMDSAGMTVRALEFMRRDYVRDLMASRGLQPPAWLSEGMAQLIATARVENGKARLGRLEMTTIRTQSGGQTSDSGQISDLSLFFTRRALLPLTQFFAIDYHDPEYRNPIGSTYSGQALGFVHYCLYGNKGRHQQAFMQWIQHLSTGGPATEEAFATCFGISTQKMNLQLRGYLTGGRYASPVTAAEPLPPVPEVELRAATPAEIARTKAQVHRLTGRTAEARAVLETALTRGFVDAPLLNTLGALELDEGHPAAAREAFARAGEIAPPDPWSRLLSVEARLAGQDQLAKAEAKRCIVDLLTARNELSVPTSRIPRLLATTMVLGGLKPDAGFTQLLQESLRRFPRDEALHTAVSRCLGSTEPQ